LSLDASVASGHGLVVLTYDFVIVFTEIPGVLCYFPVLVLVVGAWLWDVIVDMVSRWLLSVGRFAFLTPGAKVWSLLLTDVLD